MRLGIFVLALAAGCAGDGGPGDADGAGATGQGGAGAPATTGGAGGSGAWGGSGASGGVGTGGTGATGTGGAGATGTGGSGAMGTGGGGPVITESCSHLPPIPDDPAVRGPWEVGVRTVTMGRLTVEVVYPAAPGSTDGLPIATYDIRDWLPDSERDKVADDASPAVTALNGGLYRDVPIEPTYGPFPVVLMIHGTSSVRIASGSINAHWASRGFVVLAADYPGLGLKDKLNENALCPDPVTGLQDVPADVDTQISALATPAGDLSFLSGRIDMTRLGLAGHSQGACISAQLATLPNVRTIIAMTGSTVVSPGPALDNVMFIAGIEDTVIGYDTALIGNLVCPLGVSNVDGYEGSPGPPGVTKRLVGVTGGGHLLPTDLCQTNQYGRNAVEQAKLDGVCAIDNAVFIGLPALFDCGRLAWDRGNEVVWHATTLALEESLHCMDRSARISTLESDVPEIGDLREAL
jgi:hypothetical protein